MKPVAEWLTQNPLFASLSAQDRAELAQRALAREYAKSVLYIIAPGRVFGGHSLFDDEPMPATLQAIQASEVYVWHRDAILPILDRNPAIWRSITRESVGRCAGRAKSFTDLRFSRSRDDAPNFC